MDDVCYNNFLKLHAAIRILCHPKMYLSKNGFADNLVTAFVQEFILLYGEAFCVYNFHLITHLPKECLTHGPLDSFSAFPFENYLQIMLNYLKPAPKPLEQFRNRLGEHLFYGNLEKADKTRKVNGVFKCITTCNNVTISTYGSNRYVSYNQQLFKVRSICKEENRYILECFKFENLCAFYVEPTNSKSIGIYCSQFETLNAEIVKLPADEVSKVLFIQLVGMIGLIEIIHTDQ